MIVCNLGAMMMVGVAPPIASVTNDCNNNDADGYRTTNKILHASREARIGVRVVSCRVVSCRVAIDTCDCSE
jgi:hypothetical protein